MSPPTWSAIQKTMMSFFTTREWGSDFFSVLILNSRCSSLSYLISSVVSTYVCSSRKLVFPTDCPRKRSIILYVGEPFADEAIFILLPHPLQLSWSYLSRLGNKYWDIFKRASPCTIPNLGCSMQRYTPFFKIVRAARMYINILDSKFVPKPGDRSRSLSFFF